MNSNIKNQRGSPLATRLDTLRIARRVGGAAKDVTELQVDIDALQAELAEVKTIVQALDNKSTSYTPLTISSRQVSSVDPVGPSIDAYNWPTPYVQNAWGTVLDVNGAGSLNYLSFFLPRVNSTYGANVADLRITIDGVELPVVTTTFNSTTTTTGYELTIVGTLINTSPVTRLVQNFLFFKQSLKIEVRYDLASAPATAQIIVNHQRY